MKVELIEQQDLDGIWFIVRITKKSNKFFRDKKEAIEYYSTIVEFIKTNGGEPIETILLTYNS